jgi:hypothetical protein
MKLWALFSLTDKTDCEKLASCFLKEGIGILASGGTKKYLEEKGLPVTDISDFTGEPERFGGRVKTLHHKVYASLLSLAAPMLLGQAGQVLLQNGQPQRGAAKTDSHEEQDGSSGDLGKRDCQQEDETSQCQDDAGSGG